MRNSNHRRTEVIKNRLKEIRDSHPGSVRSVVAYMALLYKKDDPSAFFADVQKYGCIEALGSGIVFWIVIAKTASELANELKFRQKR